MKLALILFIVYILGMIVGFEWGQKYRHKQRNEEAPAPDYDVSNPINCRGHRGEVVEICGKPFVRMN